ncbi:MAG TPA: DNA mismatch repair endonuclease MutL [Clostridiaceae bacterium]|jgi:DNA mismatch repair protein MutL|nr:DNA mismatch repair endonuclease MutL [Clostridiaceae bacterium]
MGNIVLLDDLTINKIAAGEVIERPANVVKELVENSIDAGSNKIVIEIKNGGKTFIKVTDNGKGILLDDIDISFERHATSKIRKIEDLETTYSMGFRGEALASIVAISKLTMISKTKDENTGIKVIAKAGDILEKEEVVTQTGTSIIVEDLFFNTPVRYKFLKQDSTEFRYIKELIQKIAMANLNISFKLLNDGKTVFSSNGSGDIKDIVYILYGRECKDNIINVDYKECGIKVTGVIGNTLMARDNRKGQIIFLNKRNIKNAMITSSIDQAFKGGIGIGKHGFFILNLEMPADFYDINVHPTKMEVRFKEEDKIYKVVYHAVKNSMLNKDFLGNNEIEAKKESYIENEFEFLTNHFSKDENNESDKSKLLNNNNESKEITEENKKQELIKRETKRKIDYKYIGIIFRTYIIIEIKNELFLIDQHAAHERVLYEQIKENYKNNLKNNSQMMLLPEVINLSHKEIKFVQENIELLKNTGFDIDVFGENSIKINGIPDIEYKVNSRNIFLDILDEMLTNERGQIKDVEERFIATVACKAAVKANMDLRKEEVDKLIESLLSLKNPYTCPHGRPTTIKLCSADTILKN